MKAKVTYGLGRTVATGNYENFRLNCEATVECEQSEMEDAYKKVRKFVLDRVEDEEAELLGKYK